MTDTDDSDRFPTLSASLNDLEALCGVQYEMPATLQAFYRRNAPGQIRYAETILSDHAVAVALVRRLYSHLAMNWAAIHLEGGSAEAFGWRTLKMLVEDHARQDVADDARRAALRAWDRTVAVREAVDVLLGATQAQMADLDSPVGLFTAMAALPERQFDVIILHYALGYDSRRIAGLMGLQPGTVRRHRRLARQRLAGRLGIDLGPGEEKESDHAGTF
ncbi:sigma factor-like helix-turn-helix DNA-binding protein [Streptomyces sp. NPDC088794]|uniref:sigma factor-like helix-turn-helix DNA-binding protein n=1 Tax=Streptomyces sp. NPDC088794 TaxID=3365902 RepID=UPI00382E6090